MRFILVVAGLMLSLSLIVGGVVLAGTFNPAPSRLQASGFDVCAGQPCFMGIIPGVTSYDAALKRLRSQGHDLSSDHISLKLNNGQIVTVDSLGEYLLIGIDLYTGQTGVLPPFGDFVKAYGKPCVVFVPPQISGQPRSSDWDIARYPYFDLVVFWNNGRLDVNSPINEVDLRLFERNNDGSCRNRNDSAQNWFSFTTAGNFRKHGSAAFGE